MVANLQKKKIELHACREVKITFQPSTAEKLVKTASRDPKNLANMIE